MKNETKKYTLRIRGKFLSVVEDGFEIEPLSSLYMHDRKDVNQIRRLVRLANAGIKNGINSKR